MYAVGRDEETGDGNDRFAGKDRLFIDTDLGASDRFDADSVASDRFDSSLGASDRVDTAVGTRDRFKTDVCPSDKYVFKAKAFWSSVWVKRLVWCDERLCAGWFAA